MKQWEVLKTVFPEVITDNFEFIDYKESDTTLEYWLDEREYMFREFASKKEYELPRFLYLCQDSCCITCVNFGRKETKNADKSRLFL